MDRKQLYYKEGTMSKLVDKIEEIIESKNRLRPQYQSGYSTGTRDYYECPTCGSTIPFEMEYTMDCFTHSSDCMYKLATELEVIYKDFEKEVIEDELDHSNE